MPANSKAAQVTELLKDTSRPVDSGQLLNDLMERWGGTATFARDVMGEFQGAKQNSLVRQKILEMIQKLVVTNTVHQVTRIERPEDLDTEEIDAKLQELISRVVGHVEAHDDPQIKTVSETWEEEDAPPNFS